MFEIFQAYATKDVKMYQSTLLNMFVNYFYGSF